MGSEMCIRDRDRIQDIDLNPIMLYERGKGALTVDVRVILRRA